MASGRVRAVAGNEIPIAVTLDFHANIGEEMVDLATIVTTYDTYPHTDAAERAMEAVELLRRTVLGEIAKPPFAVLPDPAALFAGRARRLAVLAPGHQLEPYLRFLAAVHSLPMRDASHAAAAGSHSIVGEQSVPRCRRNRQRTGGSHQIRRDWQRIRATRYRNPNQPARR